MSKYHDREKFMTLLTMDYPKFVEFIKNADYEQLKDLILAGLEILQNEKNTILKIQIRGKINAMGLEVDEKFRKKFK
ncbi:MAG: hypothetical protein KatS3mg003_1067 [Candidatus Nitrosocaldaceae archaeon]|nr:MAG: hypothetical protein KatS3mg003_1067 [Candidatus Nitrosocaldaceae archaeon]